MCPAITEEPTSPGRGLPVYQPATEVTAGTCSVPLAVMPSLISLVCTPMAGMVRDTGAGAAGAGEEPGAGAADPDGAGTDALASRPAAGPGWPVSMTRPAAPSASTTRPKTTPAPATARRGPGPGGPPGGGPPGAGMRGGGTYRDGSRGAWPRCGGPRCP